MKVILSFFPLSIDGTQGQESVGMLQVTSNRKDLEFNIDLTAVRYKRQGDGVTTSNGVEIWDVEGYEKGDSPQQCAEDVWADSRCAKDYFTYANADKNCGCRPGTAGDGNDGWRADPRSDLYRFLPRLIDQKCPDGYEQMGDFGDDVPGCGYAGCKDVSFEECAEGCTLDDNCQSFEYTDGEGNPGRCGYNNEEESTEAKQTGSWFEALTCKKAAVNLCPDGYEQLGEMGADVPGCGLLCQTKVKVMDACRRICDAHPKCRSFEYNAKKKTCGYNDNDASTEASQTGTWDEALTCKRTASPAPGPPPPPPPEPEWVLYGFENMWCKNAKQSMKEPNEPTTLTLAACEELAETLSARYFQWNSQTSACVPIIGKGKKGQCKLADKTNWFVYQGPLWPRTIKGTICKSHEHFVKSQQECQEKALDDGKSSYQYNAKGRNGRKNCATFDLRECTEKKTGRKAHIYTQPPAKEKADVTGTPDTPGCVGCAESLQCMSTCGGAGLCDKCNGERGTLGACCKKGDTSDPFCASVSPDSFLFEDHHTCVLVADPVVKQKAENSFCQGERKEVLVGNSISLGDCITAVVDDPDCGIERIPSIGYGYIEKRFDYNPSWRGGECQCARNSNICTRFNPSNGHTVYIATIPEKGCEDTSTDCAFIKSRNGCALQADCTYKRGCVKSFFEDVNEGRCDATCQRCTPKCEDPDTCLAWCTNTDGQYDYDRIGKKCYLYKKMPENCGKFDDEDFSAFDMCCACQDPDTKLRGGKQEEPPLAPLPEPSYDGGRACKGFLECTYKQTGCLHLPKDDWEGWSTILNLDSEDGMKWMYDLCMSTEPQDLERCCGSNKDVPDCPRVCHLQSSWAGQQ